MALNVLSMFTHLKVVKKALFELANERYDARICVTVSDYREITE